MTPIRPMPISPFVNAAIIVVVLYFWHEFLDSRGFVSNPEWVNVSGAAFLMAVHWAWREFRWGIERP